MILCPYYDKELEGCINPIIKNVCNLMFEEDKNGVKYVPLSIGLCCDAAYFACAKDRYEWEIKAVDNEKDGS